jgi:hypothetical protein
MPGMTPDAVAPQGLSWSWELDFDALMAALADAGLPATHVPGACAADGGPARMSSPGNDSSPASQPSASQPSASQPSASQPSAGPPRSGPLQAGPPSGAGDGTRPTADTAAQEPVRDLGDLDAGRDEADGLGPTEDAAPLSAGALAGRLAERLAPGPDLAAWLAMAPPADLDDAGLAAVAGSWRRIASWAQARELAAVAQIASRAAARDEDIGTGPDGRPARVPASAAAEVALELTMSQYGASWWTDLAVTLSWRLTATGAALAAGMIDLPRARLIAEATAALSDETARAVQDRILPMAGDQTSGMLRAALRRAVIAADPQGAEDRRKEAERRAKVVLYPDEDHTATLAGQRLPTVHAAAAMARIKAMARALKAAGADGGIDLLCAQIYVGLLLGTLPLIPPADGALPDEPPDGPADDPPDSPADGPAPDGPPDDPGKQRPSAPSGSSDPGDSGQPPGRPRGPGADPNGPPGGPRRPSADRSTPPDAPAAPPGEVPPRGPADDYADPGWTPGRSGDPGERSGAPPPGTPSPSPPSATDAPPPGTPSPSPPSATDAPPPRQDPSPIDDVPPPGDADAPRDEDDYPCPDDGPALSAAGLNDDDDGWPDADWPSLPAAIPPVFARPDARSDRARSDGTRTGDARSDAGRQRGTQPDPTRVDGDSRDDAGPSGVRPGLLDVSLPWQVLAGLSADPGHLGRIGPVTAAQARRLAECAADDPGAEWRIIVTSPDGAALAVTRIRRPRSCPPTRPRQRDGPAGSSRRIGASRGIGLVSRVTLTIPADLAANPPLVPGSAVGSGPPGKFLDLAVQAAARAAARAEAAAVTDAAAGGCAHASASPSYRPPPRLHDYIAARDLTCRFPVCRQPAWRSDLDHTVPFDDGGLTCRCNLGGLCRTHHIIKHHPGWKLEQRAPGSFTWTTPSGRTFTTTPDTHVV